MVFMETRSVLGNVAANLGQILLISIVLAACVGIGSWLTQFALKVPIDYNLVAELAVIFGIITAFAGIVFSLVAKR
jgi:predicted PurR-regulated permease PerM